MKNDTPLLLTRLLLALAMLTTACKSNTSIQGDGKTKPGASRDEGADSDKSRSENGTADAETVNIPNAITGALLTCVTQEANDKVEVKIACRYENADKVRVPLSSIAKTQSFSYSGSPASGITVSILPADANYEVFYSITGANFAALNAAAKTLQIKVALSGLVNGDPDKTIGGKGGNIATPPPPRWAREPTSDSNGNGLCDGAEACIFIGNGLMWMRDDNVPRNHIDSTQGCGNIQSPFSGWHLPRTVDMNIAYEKGIWDLASPAALNISDLPYWSNMGPVPGTTTLPDDTTYAVNYRSGVQSNQRRADVLHSICVREI